MNKKFSIRQYGFDSDIERRLYENHRDHLTFPLVYFIRDQRKKNAYVGETTDVVNRMKTHLKNEQKKQLTSVDFIISDFFNKSAALDVESNLIRYLHADGEYELQNGNLGICNHRYYQQKEVYWEMFREIWNDLRSLGIARHSLEYIDNSDLFKYSPYKALSKEQVNSLKLILQCLLDDSAKTTLIQGGAGTGKSILAIFLFKLLKTNLEDFNLADFEEQDQELLELLSRVKVRHGDLSMALVIPMASFRKTISKVFKNVKGLSPFMVIGPSDLAKNSYDLVIVDEGHRLRRRVNLGPYFKPFDDTCEALGLDKNSASELDWIALRSNKSLIFYDQLQSIKPSDVLRERFVQLEKDGSTRIETLKYQFRCKGGNEYAKLVYDILSNTAASPYQSLAYECFLFDDIQLLVETIRQKEQQAGLARLVAGYAWEWVSNKDKTAFDIVIDNTSLRWNSVAIDWVNTPNSINEVGCIHTTQGYDLNYAGIIIGPELDYNFETRELVIYKERYKDKAGKNTIRDEDILRNYILNIYKTILLRGIQGTFIYACNENMRNYLAQFIQVKTNSHPAQRDLRISETPNERTVPLYDLEIAAGSFSEQQRIEKIRYVELDQHLPNIHNYFACKVIGESMNRVIPNGSICLFEKYSGGSRNGLITLVELTDYTDPETGSSYTVKEYSSKKTISEVGWKHEEISLLPKSTESYEPIVLQDDESMGLKVVGVFVRVVDNLKNESV